MLTVQAIRVTRAVLTRADRPDLFEAITGIDAATINSYTRRDGLATPIAPEHIGPLTRICTEVEDLLKDNRAEHVRQFVSIDHGFDPNSMERSSFQRLRDRLRFRPVPRAA